MLYIVMSKSQEFLEIFLLKLHGKSGTVVVCPVDIYTHGRGFLWFATQKTGPADRLSDFCPLQDTT